MELLVRIFDREAALNDQSRALVSMELKHPQFLKVRVLAPMVFGNFPHNSINFHENDTENVTNLSWQKITLSTHSLKFLTGALQRNSLDVTFCTTMNEFAEEVKMYDLTQTRPGRRGY